MWVEICVWIFLLFHTFTDMKWKKVNVMVCVFFSIAGLLMFSFCDERDVYSLLGGIMAGVYLLVFSVLTKEAVGFGDGCVVTAVGIWIGGGKTFAVLMGGFILAALFGIVKIAMKKASGKTELAYIPFFTISYITFYVGGFL